MMINLFLLQATSPQVSGAIYLVTKIKLQLCAQSSIFKVNEVGPIIIH